VPCISSEGVLSDITGENGTLNHLTPDFSTNRGFADFGPFRTTSHPAKLRIDSASSNASEEPAMRTPPNVSRRKFMMGTLRAGGLGLGLNDILRLRSQAMDHGSIPPDTSVIQIWLGGGPSQFETFDPKPSAPIEIRGPYEAISSALPGIPICEMMPLTAGLIDRTSIIRSFTHAYDDHFGLTRWCLAGRREASNANSYPSVGSIAAKYRGGVALASEKGREFST
jgi:hypothetical protein